MSARPRARIQSSQNTCTSEYLEPIVFAHTQRAIDLLLIQIVFFRQTICTSHCLIRSTGKTFFFFFATVKSNRKDYFSLLPSDLDVSSMMKTELIIADSFVLPLNSITQEIGLTLRIKWHNEIDPNRFGRLAVFSISLFQCIVLFFNGKRFLPIAHNLNVVLLELLLLGLSKSL